MTNIKIFKNQEFGFVRTTEHNGEIAFVAKDVAERLDYTWQVNVISHVPDEWRGVNRINVRSENGVEQEREMLVLTEQGLYFFLGRSDKPLALPFQKWIAGEVVPTIRRHGAYLTPQTIEEVLSNPDTIIKIATQLKQERQLRVAAETKIAEDKPLVEFAKQIGDCPGGVNLRDLGKVFRQNGADFGQNGLIDRLLEDGFLYRDKTSRGNLRPYAEHVQEGLFWEKEVVISSSQGDFQTFHVKVTGKGQQYFLNLYLPKYSLAPEVGGDFPVGYLESMVV